MTTSRSLAVFAASATMVLAGCSSGASHVMGGGNNLMGGGSGYHYSSLTCSAPRLPGHTVEVKLADMGMTQMMGGVASMGAHMSLSVSPATVPAGRVSLVASNRGWRTHELVILPLTSRADDGQRLPRGDGKVDEAGDLGEASKSCSGGAGEGIRAGAVGWTTVTLSRGRYELVCNLRNHYEDGMHQELVVD
jgi:uncharacterized cupredoxin-like copper-binding protein